MNASASATGMAPQSVGRFDNSQTYWEQVAEKRWGAYISSVERKWIHYASGLFPQKQSFLEIGCEGGRWSQLLCDQGWQAVCTDINAENLKLCQARLPAARCHLVEKNSIHLPCDDDAFKLLLCIEVIPVILSDWFLPEAKRVLQENGVLVGVFNNKRSLRGWPLHIANRKRDRFDWYAGDYVEWKRKARAQGFRVIAEEGLCWFPFARCSNSPLIPVFTKLERLFQLHRLPSISPWVVFVARKVN